ncbi:anhydro-N-acetylmuramic acid kinase [Pedobacter metabolipauper]|uniref:Anhydro-N-acetylmuramic acid kinase n=1 Tax=Pedobacter metabolipauper TaxID=425513 RepID=A0A4R6SYI6_9SPHI|nr:anhydro-N-acetylmuramic acid kinase [Pedobacter metabolipauper]TDQ09744.1 anhydro-N-acetylmuramic acid kinase [Pedobacter metabolipauper]
MNANWDKVFQIINKPERRIIGLMSGTSLDGLDIALCAVKGKGSDTSVRILEFKTVPYTDGFKKDIKSIFSKRDADLQMISLMNAQIGLVHGGMILEAIASWGLKPDDVDVIASHGQTIFHAPQSLHGLEGYPNATLQIGDGDHIAVKTGIVTIADFRQKHLAAGGEGAPLAVYGDYLLFSKPGEDRIMLNIGGIANFTYLPGNGDASKVFSTDLGPGNTIMDQYVQKNYPGLYFDKDGSISASGTSNGLLLDALMKEDFLDAGFPKTTGPELFNLSYLEKAQKQSATTDLSTADVMATLCNFTARVIVRAVERCFGVDNTFSMYMSGGGMHNPELVRRLNEALPGVAFYTTASLGIDPDAKEAVLFAVLANETLVGDVVNFGDRQGVPAVCMGKICLPY